MLTNYDYKKLSEQLPYLRQYLVLNPKSNFTDTDKKLPLYVFNNVKINGRLSRYKMWEVLFYVSFYISSTTQSLVNFNDNFEYQRYVKKNKIGLCHIKDDIVTNISAIPWWTYDLDTLVFYNHEHDINNLKLGRKNFFEIEIRLFPPDTLALANDVQAVKELYKEATVWISNLNSFQTNGYVQFISSKESPNT